LIAGIFKNVPSVKKAVISVHCHNDLGMATANSLTAVRKRRPAGGNAPSTASVKEPETPHWKKW